jgi:hypothetical protein
VKFSAGAIVRSFILIVAWTSSALQAAGAQWPAQVTPGARVQVRLPEIQYQFDWVRGQPIRGRVASLASDTLYLAVGDSLGPLAVPRRLIQRLEYSKGVGLVTGATLVAIFPIERWQKAKLE